MLEIKYIFKQINMPLLTKTGRAYFIGKYFELKSSREARVYLKIKSPTQDNFDLRDRISNKLQVLRQRPDITWNVLQKYKQRAQICIDEDGY